MEKKNVQVLAEDILREMPPIVDAVRKRDRGLAGSTDDRRRVGIPSRPKCGAPGRAARPSVRHYVVSEPLAS